MKDIVNFVQINSYDELHFPCSFSLSYSVRNILYGNIIHKGDIFNEMNNEEKLCHLLTEQWKINIKCS